MGKKLEPEEKERRKQERKQARAQSATAAPEKTTPKAEVVRPLKVEITFPSIVDLKQALAFDSAGNLIIGIQFKAKVDQYEIFRLVNLLKQPHGVLYAIIGSPQSAMDFLFNPKEDRMDILKAASQLVAAKTDDKGEITTKPLIPEQLAVKIHAVAFNHLPEEKKPYGVAIDYIGKDGSGEIYTVAGRGTDATEAVLAGVARILPPEMKEPFEVIAALEELEPSPEGYRLIRAIQVGSFDEEPGKGGSKEDSKGK